MGVYIKGMEMPTSCWACACYHHKVDDGYYDYDVCQASGTVFNDGYSSATGHRDHIDPFKQRLDDCPLVPVPPHGRLIDADATIADIRGEILEHQMNGMKGTPFYIEDLRMMWQRLEDEELIPTVIPAEQAEEKRNE